MLLLAVVPVLLLVFAVAHASLSHESSAHISEPLDHTGALHLTTTVLSTVGFGDITPESDVARLVVRLQMLLDLVVIGALVRLLTTAARIGRRDADAS